MSKSIKLNCVNIFPGMTTSEEEYYDEGRDDGDGGVESTTQSIEQLKSELIKKRRKHKELLKENVEVGVMFAARFVRLTRSNVLIFGTRSQPPFGGPRCHCSGRKYNPLHQVPRYQ